MYRLASYKTQVILHEPINALGPPVVPRDPRSLERKHKAAARAAFVLGRKDGPDGLRIVIVTVGVQVDNEIDPVCAHCLGEGESPCRVLGVLAAKGVDWVALAEGVVENEGDLEIGLGVNEGE